MPLPTEQRPRITPLRDGPYLVAVDDLTNSKGERLEAWHGVALCRCGASAKKPFCDGSHIRIGFSSERRADHVRDGVVDYPGADIIVHFNRLQCAASERCARQLPQVFREGEKPWIRPDAADPERLIVVIRQCPSGALRYTRHGQTGPLHENSPSIRVTHNGPYEVQGLDLDTQIWCEGASGERFMLCRCGASRNKPFCDGSHRNIDFQDERN
jgi:CDGSH-type Zn-finger protein